MYERIEPTDPNIKPTCTHCGWSLFFTSLVALYAILATALIVIPNRAIGNKDAKATDFSTGTYGSKHAFKLEKNGNDDGGFSTGSGFHIQWATASKPSHAHASAQQVLEATLARMEFIQSTPQANNRNAQALWHVMLARDVLANQQTNQHPPIDGVER